ncbi:MAG: hydroxymethylbilane synthase [Parasporobacterium sp.]|nr:hydroxymethylbilane synthase [Parasporobacterium sp.]
MRKIIVGSRDSQLAVAQSRMVISYIREHVPDVEPVLLTMKTTGDRILDRTLDQVGGKGLFVKELDRALWEHRADITVHSLKDIPMELPPDLPLVAFSRREDPRDALILPEGAEEPDPELPIGTSSLRRQIQLKKLYPGYRIEPVRGNLQTRLRKLEEGQFGALVLASAGLKRMGLEGRIRRYFTIREILPAAGQGIIAVQGRAEEDYSWLQGLNDPEAQAAALAERAYVRELDGGCTSPVCAHAEIAEGRICLTGLFYEETTGGFLKDSLEGAADQAEQIGIRLAEKLREQCRRQLPKDCSGGRKP